MNAQVKTFRAPDPRAALDAVKAAFGDEAVILHTREVRGGLWGRCLRMRRQRFRQERERDNPSHPLGPA